MTTQRNAIQPPSYQLNPDSVTPQTQMVDVIVCVHNALLDVQNCLNSVLAHSVEPYQLIIVDDGSDSATRDYLHAFAQQHSVQLLRNEQACGYTCAANQGLAVSTSPYAILLNSDTIVTPYWLPRLVACAESDSRIGMVGPLSNTASWQSIPNVEVDGDWANNPLPLDMTVAEMGNRVAGLAARLYPRLPFLNGFCLLIKQVLRAELGGFDETHFAQGYGEENDYCIRARQAGWELAVADDVYIYHAQSKSYSHERRKQLCDRAMTALIAKHGSQIIDEGVAICRDSRVMAGIRARAKILLERWHCIAEAQYRWRGKKVVFMLPVMESGGGANIVLTEAAALQRMGIEVAILNFCHHQVGFEASYPDLTVPVIYVEAYFHIPDICSQFDAVIATAYNSVEWIAPVADYPNPPIMAYYIQDFEPYFYVHSPTDYHWFWRYSWLRRRFASYYFRRNQGFREAWLSYFKAANMRLFTKTAWNQYEVEQQIKRPCKIIGASYDNDRFMPRLLRSEASGRLKIAAMIRPSSYRRGALQTMRVLQAIEKAYAAQVEIVLFGCAEDDPLFVKLPRDFTYQQLGILTTSQIAELFNEVDIFVDFSQFQAMGLTAMEAMACGVAVIVPQCGGTDSFAQHQRNAWVVDTLSYRACYESLAELVNNHTLRVSLMTQACQDMPHYYPEKSAAEMLKIVFEN